MAQPQKMLTECYIYTMPYTLHFQVYKHGSQKGYKYGSQNKDEKAIAPKFDNGSVGVEIGHICLFSSMFFPIFYKLSQQSYITFK